MKRLHARYAHVINFYRQYIGPALEVQRAEGIPALFTLSQMANETGYGVSRPGFNLFGVKASIKLPESERQLQWTTEYDQSPDARYPEIAPGYPILVPDRHHKGKTIWKYKVKDWFRVYASEAESMRHHTQVLHQRNYAEVWKHTSDPEAFTRAVARGGYATAPDYASALIAGIHLLNRIAALVNQQDAAAAAGAASAPVLTGAH
jgi:flagellar protein FlgJ